jgi:hypothetical protein
MRTRQKKQQRWRWGMRSIGTIGDQKRKRKRKQRRR